MLELHDNVFSFLEREIEKRKYESLKELEARREERRRKKRSVSPSNEKSIKKSRTSPNYAEVVTVSDTSDVEMKSDSHNSEPEEGTVNEQQIV